MFKNAVRIAIASTILFISGPLASQVKMPAFFSDHMILQRNKPCAVWGWAAPGENITVAFGGQTKMAKADTEGKWVVWLNAMKASDQPRTMMIKASNQVQLSDILVGDIWLCSGQSNMEYTLDRKLKRYAAPKKGADLSEAALLEPKPDAIRYLYVERTLNKIPLLPTKCWVNGNDSMVRYISAIGYFFAKEIYENTKVPVGILSSSWGGTRIEQWIPDWAYANAPAFKDSMTTGDFKIDGIHPGQMFHGMLEPIFPFTIAGCLWYQGESDCLIHDMNTYPAKFELMIETWRSLFKDAKLPFYTVQIAPHLYTKRKDPLVHTGETLPEFWESQTNCLKLKQTEMIVTTDLVDNLADIHPSYKWTVAHRLALVARNKFYHEKGIISDGPKFKKASIHADNIELSFDHTGSGLISGDGQPLSWFSIAGEDGNFVPATAQIQKNKLMVSAPGIQHPKYVRFAWDEKAQPNLFNKEGLPALPFRTGK